MKILITGVAGVGKTTVLAELQKIGYLVIDLDATGMCRWIDKKTGEHTPYGLHARDYNWLNQHSWTCDVEKLKVLLSCISEDKPVFVGGYTDNLQDILPLFDKVILLKASNNQIKERLLKRTNNHFAKADDEQKYIFEQNEIMQQELSHAILVDSDNLPEKIAYQIRELVF